MNLRPGSFRRCSNVPHRSLGNGLACLSAGISALCLVTGMMGANPPMPPPLPQSTNAPAHTVLCKVCGKPSASVQTVEIVNDVVLNDNPKGPRGFMVKFNYKCNKCGAKFRVLGPPQQ